MPNDRPNALAAVMASSPGRGLLLPFVMSATIVSLVLGASRIEMALNPVLGMQAIPEDGVTRTDHTLCWERISYKKRLAPVVNFDVFLDRVNPETGRFDDQHRSFPEVYAEAPPHDPVSTDRTPGIGWTRRRLCVDLPANVKPGQPIRLQQIAHFRGLFSLWDLSTALPEIVSPPGAG